MPRVTAARTGPYPAFMSSEEPGADERWQDLMRSMDPVANLNALADVWRDAATSSERVVGSFIGTTDTDEPGTSGSGSGPSSRDVFADFERSVDQVSEAAKRFFAQMPFGLHDEATAKSRPTSVAVLDGVGTTEISLPGLDPWATDLMGHDGERLPANSVTLRRTADLGAPSNRDEASFIVKVTVPEATSIGVFHGQILLTGDPGFVLPLTVRVHGSDE